MPLKIKTLRRWSRFCSMKKSHAKRKDIIRSKNEWSKFYIYEYLYPVKKYYLLWSHLIKLYQNFITIYAFVLWRIPTNTPCVFHVETTWKRSFPRVFNVEHTRCICGNKIDGCSGNSRFNSFHTNVSFLYPVETS